MRLTASFNADFSEAFDLAEPPKDGAGPVFLRAMLRETNVQLGAVVDAVEWTRNGKVFTTSHVDDDKSWGIAVCPETVDFSELKEQEFGCEVTLTPIPDELARLSAAELSVVLFPPEPAPAPVLQARAGLAIVRDAGPLPVEPAGTLTATPRQP